ncbi:MAG: hypothetical protein ACR2Q3_18345 [Woeseiaceae bacterium]
MNRIMLTGLIVTLAAGSSAVLAQDSDPPQGFAYVTYFECNAGREYRADEIIERSYKPHYDAAVEAGDILQWSWLSHFVGGKWRRALVLSAPDMDNLLSSAGALGEAIAESTPEAGRVFTEICPIHEDYIWETVPGVGGTTVGEARGMAGLSIYMDCDMNREERVDELMSGPIGEVYDAHVLDGELVSWTWLAHTVGGQYRRLLSLTADDHNSMMRARAAIIADLDTGRMKRSYTQMNEICPDHDDYMWDIQMATP